ncbi:related to transposase [Ustilago trichophora]|uniref:Related to transposase n=1 Tax=Ustilago trichophora TaxID=86804 RepID=A0A5C3DZN4_9BASI|nr:related to transposase [Ustilago trichophora]
MPRPSSSYLSIASCADRAADCNAQEARLQQAAAELGNETHLSLCRAAAANNVPEATLRHRLLGRQTKQASHANQQALTPAAETALLEHIQRCACSGFPLMPALIRDYANTILRGILGCSQAPDVGTSWLQGFLRRHPSIRSQWSRCLNNARLTGATKDNIWQFYNQLTLIMCNYAVPSTNIFNMDETGFMFGVGSSEQVLVPAGNQAARF